jgi:hypothetical protein
MEKVNTQFIPNTKYEIRNTAFERSIFATIAYYDYFNYPLTAVEVYQYLIKSCHKNVIASDPSADGARGNPAVMCTNNGIASSLPRVAPRNDNKKPKFSEIIETLDNIENLKRFIEHKNGFYFLAGREEIIWERIRRKKLTDQKFKKSRWILRFLSCPPFTRLIMMSGTMAIGNPYKESDIDLLVVAKAGRIWTTRACLTFFAMLLGKYRTGEKTENRLCLNHYVTDKSLAIDFGNLYKAEEYLNLAPIAGELKIYDDFLAANRGWMENYVFFGGDNRENLRTFAPSKIFLKIKYFFERMLGGKIGDWFEKTAKNLQISFIEKNPLTSCPRGRVRYADDNLVFHPVLIEREVIKKYEEKIKQSETRSS